MTHTTIEANKCPCPSAQVESEVRRISITGCRCQEYDMRMLHEAINFLTGSYRVALKFLRVGKNDGQMALESATSIRSLTPETVI